MGNYRINSYSKTNSYNFNSFINIDVNTKMKAINITFIYYILFILFKYNKI
jgi:hypothetical protein